MKREGAHYRVVQEQLPWYDLKRIVAYKKLFLDATVSANTRG